MADDIRQVPNLTPGEAGDDGREGVNVGLEDDIIGNAPALPARMKIFDQLVHRAEMPILLIPCLRLWRHH